MARDIDELKAILEGADEVASTPSHQPSEISKEAGSVVVDWYKTTDPSVTKMLYVIAALVDRAYESL